MTNRAFCGRDQLHPWRRAVISVIFACLGPVAWAQSPLARGEEFQINTTFVGAQLTPDVAGTADGFVVAWTSATSRGSDSSGLSVQARRFDAEGSPIGDDFQVNTYTQGTQATVAVGMAPGGDFVVSWYSYDPPGPDPHISVQAQRFAADGSLKGEEFQVNTYSTGRQYLPSVAMTAEQDFVIAWTSRGSSGSDQSEYSCLGRRFASDGTPKGEDFQVNTYTTSTQFSPAVATLKDGGFVVAWQSLSRFGFESLFVRGQRYDSAGSPLGGEFQVNTYTSGETFYPSDSAVSVATGPDDSFVVVWHNLGSGGSDTSGFAILGRRFAPDGKPIGDEFQVNAYTTGSQVVPDVAIGPYGETVVVWRSTTGPGDNFYNVQGRIFDANGAPFGDQFLINTYTEQLQRYPAVAFTQSGEFVVAWQSYGSYGSDTSSRSIQGQRYASPVVFADGFESGDTSAWSSSVTLPF